MHGSLELSDREHQILESLAHGHTHRFIADEFCIGLETVKTHVKSIYRKLDVSSRDEAVAAYWTEMQNPPNRGMA